MPRLLTVQEAATVLAAGESTVRALIAGGQIIACRLGTKGGSIRIREEDLQAYIVSTRHRKVPPDRPRPARPVSDLAAKYFPKLYGQRPA